MADAFTISPGRGMHVVRAGGAVLFESDAVLVLEEPGHAPVVYFPRDTAAMAFLDRSETRTTCPHKGEATYYDIVAKSGPIRDACWSYEAPVAGAEAIAGHLAFAHERVTVERL